MNKKIIFPILFIASFFLVSGLVSAAGYCENKRDNPDLRPYYGSNLHLSLLENNEDIKNKFIKDIRNPMGKIFFKNYIEEVRSCTGKRNKIIFYNRLNEVEKMLV